MQQINRALIFAHYDRDGVIDPHVQYAIKCYREVVNRLVVVSTSATALPGSIAQHVDHFISRPNKGYDFCSWKEGIEVTRRLVDNLMRSFVVTIVCTARSLISPQSWKVHVWLELIFGGWFIPYKELNSVRLVSRRIICRVGFLVCVEI